MTAPTRELVVAKALELNALLPTIIERYPDDADFWPAFAGYADPIMALAGQLDDDTHDDVFLIIEGMLWGAGKFGPEHVLQT